MRARPRSGPDSDFLRLWIGEGISDFGTAVGGVVIPLIAVVSLNASAFEVGALSSVQWLPWLLIGLPAGAWVDRIRRRNLMIACDIVRAAALISVPIAAARGSLTLHQLFAVGLVTGTATVLFQVAYQSYLPALVEPPDLPAANARLQGTQSAAAVAGPGVGGAIVQVVQAPFALCIDAGSYIVSAVALLLVQAREQTRKPPAHQHLLREIRDGLRFVAADPLLRALTVAPALSNLLTTGATTLYVYFLIRDVQAAPRTVGVVVALTALGSVLGAVAARPLSRRIGTSRAIWLVNLVAAPVALLIPLTTGGLGLGFYVLGNVVLFGGTLVYNVTAASFRQTYCPPEILGRATASMRFLSYGVIPIGKLAGGALATALGSRTALWLLLAANILPALMLAVSPLRAIRDLPDGPARARVNGTAP
jgi:MFS family permease